MQQTLAKESLKLSDFHYEFSPERMGLKKTESRSDSRMLIYDRLTKEISHHHFYELPLRIDSPSFLVVNQTYVEKSRFFAKKCSTNARLEGVFLDGDQHTSHVWLKGKVQAKEDIELFNGKRVSVISREGPRAVLHIPSEKFRDYLKKHGVLPLPPYIRKERLRQGLEEYNEKDEAAYQTLFADPLQLPSAAAPTASLHFDKTLLYNLQNKQIPIVEICLQVGEGTFAPIRVENIENHQMHDERVEISKKAWDQILNFKAEGRKLIAVGTTVVRSLESAIRRPEPYSFSTDLFIRPPFEFKMVDQLITNFHWPDSTLLVLAASFIEAQQNRCSSELRHDWRRVYETALQNRYQLFSYGDGMWIR